jgi:hypothetical protein
MLRLVTIDLQSGRFRPATDDSTILIVVVTLDRTTPRTMSNVTGARRGRFGRLTVG